MEELPKNQRKACDDCYRRKIKCDGEKPRCSHCVSYDVDCTFAAPSRRYQSKKRRRITEHDETDDLRARIQELEHKIEQLSVVSHSIEPRNEVTARLRGEVDATSSWPSSALQLPPIQQTIRYVELYFQNFNTVLPLFDRRRFLRIFHKCYDATPSQRDLTEWAAIYLVLALSSRYCSVETDHAKQSMDALRKVESVLQHIILQEASLLTIQVLVGMVILLQGSHDLQPGLILIATTLRLAHRIGLHNRFYSEQLEPRLALERANVFWLAYILDKDISMRAKQPSVQLDDDIDLDFPSSSPISDAVYAESLIETDEIEVEGHLSSTKSLKQAFFSVRVELAIVQGAVYDYLYSTRSRNFTFEERVKVLDNVTQALERWKASLPPSFCNLEAARTMHPELLPFLTILLAKSLQCTTSIGEADAWNEGYINSLRRSKDSDRGYRLPPSWRASMDEARSLLSVHEEGAIKDEWHFWEIGCGYMTGMLLLTANTMADPRHERSVSDHQLVHGALQYLEETCKAVKSGTLQHYLHTCTELHEYIGEKYIWPSFIALE